MDRNIKKIKAFSDKEILEIGEFGFQSDTYYAIENTHVLNFEYFGLMPKPYDQPIRSTWPELLTEMPKYIKTFGVYQDQKLCGFISVKPSIWNKSLKIKTLFVLEKFRNDGIGRLLIDYVTDYGEERAFSFLTLEVQSINGDAVAFYKTLGFKITGLNQCSNRSYTLFMHKGIQGHSYD